jgi:alpha-L-rhamnosidase
MCRLVLLIPFLLLSIIGKSQAQAPCSLSSLRTEHLEEPIGVDNPHPRLSWRMEDDRPGAKQLAYQVIVGQDSLQVVNNRGEQWDTNKQMTGDMSVVYEGADLFPCTKYYWKVKAWGVGNNEYSSDVHSFETGLMSANNWNGSWISDNKDIYYKPASYFRKKFTLNKKVKSARVYIAVAGLYELYIDGEKIGNHRLDPMYTRFDRRNLYVTYDVTSQLQKTHDNAIGVLLGNGWYNHQTKAVWDFDKAPWRNRPAFCLDLKIVYTDGSRETVSTDLGWRRSDSPLMRNSIYTGEDYDARLEKKGWNQPDYDDSKWEGVAYRSAPSNNITSQQIRPIRNVQVIPAQSLRKIDEKTYLFDFGQNMSGVTKICVSGKEGTRVQLKHGERLAGGRLDMSNIDVYFRGDKDTDPFQTDILFLSGKGNDEYMTKFNYKGFRYVEVTADEPIDLDKNSVTAYFMHSDVLPIGKINTSSDLLNRIWKATNNAYLSNLMGLPTDCPQREKNGWTGDSHFAIETGLYNYDGITVYEKWLADHRDEQQPNGVLPDIIPTGGWGYGTANGLDWTSSIAIIPWNLYLFYGDSKPLADCYENIKRYVNYVDRTSINGLTSWGRGDWVPVKSQSNLELTSSVYFYVDAKILANTAKLFNKKADYEYYTALATKIKNAVNNKYLNRETGIYASGTQTELSVPLQWKIVPEDQIPLVAQNLAKRVEVDGFHLDVGVLGAKAILNALSENGYANIAYKIASQDTYPSWGWWIVNGATTLLENWDLNAKRDISDNHMMFGEIGGWLFKGLGGIFPDPEQPGFKHIILRPNFIKELSSFEAQYDSPYGQIISKWQLKKNKLINYEVVVPANSNATLYLPNEIAGKKVMELQSGRHNIVLKYAF